tara:strand:+ start:97 stop:516 length:420 start_codon:yes stop_codon:yes gene_type:complete
MLSLTVSDTVFQWYMLGWTNIIVRRVKGGWCRAEKGDSLKLNSAGSGSVLTFQVEDLQYSDSIDQLINDSNYLKICSCAQSVESAKRYVARTLHFFYGSPPVEGELFVSATIVPTDLGTTESHLYTTCSSNRRLTLSKT